MKNKIKVYVVGYSTHYANWIKDVELVSHILDAEIILFTGGEDVDPRVYREKKGSRTYANYQRDLREIAAFETAVANRIPMLGICRGAQLICAMSGGRLIQDQHNPGSHPMLTIDGMEYPVNSLHHQAMYPYEMSSDKYKVLGWTEGISKSHLDGDDEEISDKPFKEVEIAYFPKVKGLGIQFHPEMLSGKTYAKTLNYCNELVTNLLNNKI